MNKYTVRALKSNIIKLKVRLNGIKLEVRKEIIIFFRIGGVILVETGHKLLIRIQVLIHAHGYFILYSGFYFLKNPEVYEYNSESGRQPRICLGTVSDLPL